MERRKGEYGFDAPYVLLAFSVGTVVGLVAGVVGLMRSIGWLAIVGLGYAASFSLSTASYLWTTRRGKIAIWAELLDEMGLRGDEHLLDVGCGRGAVLTLAAARLPRGRVVGVDVWSRVDQSGNAEAVARRNAGLEGVADRVELHTGDMRQLPFPDETFDVVTSSLAIHNVRGAGGRAKALDEIVRVLKNEGVALLTDLRFTGEYEGHLRRTNVGVIARRRLGWRSWFGGPQAGMTLVTVHKSQRPEATRGR